MRVMLLSKAGPGLILTALSLSACGSQSDASPPLKGCTASACDPVEITTSRGTGGSSAGGGTGTNTTGVAVSVSAVEFTGTSSGTDAWSLQYVRGLNETVLIQASNTTGGVLEASDNSPITFTNVLADGSGWATVTPPKNSGFLPGMRGIPVDPGAGISVPLLRTADLDFVTTLLTTKALVVDPTKAQLVIKFEDSSGHGVSGIHVTDLGGDVLAYASSTSSSNWDINTASTDSSGRVMGINIPASGAAVLYVSVSASGLNLQGASITVTGRLPILAGFVTYAVLLVP